MISTVNTSQPMHDSIQATPLWDLHAEPRQPAELQGEVLVRAEGVGKKFCRDLKKSLWYGLKDVAAELNPLAVSGIDSEKVTLRKGEFWANRNISFELRRGECLGLIGRNGAGKTTLLKMLNGLIKPDTGRIEMRGRVGALIALGAGFNPILTGRENIYVNGSILGLSKREIDEKLEEIIDFSEIREFIDSPVQSYSSGMKVRLGFAVATALKPDVLILDEVLAVGDFVFKQKCLKRILELIDNCAVIFVSHNFLQIEQICTRALLLERGRCVGKGEVYQIRKMYDELNPEEDSTMWTAEGLEIVGEAGITLVETSVGYDFRVKLRSEKMLKNLAARLRFQDSSGDYVAEFHSLNHGESLTVSVGEHWLEVALPSPPLKRGCYSVDFFLNQNSNDMIKVIVARKVTKFESRVNPCGIDSVQF